MLLRILKLIKGRLSFRLVFLFTGTIINPKRELKRQSPAITRLHPLHPKLSTKHAAAGANINVPTPEPQTETPEKE